MELCKGVGMSFQAVRPSVEVGKTPWNEIQDLRDEISKLKEERYEIMQLAKKERYETMVAKRLSGR